MKQIKDQISDPNQPFDPSTKRSSAILSHGQIEKIRERSRARARSPLDRRSIALEKRLKATLSG